MIFISRKDTEPQRDLRDVLFYTSVAITKALAATGAIRDATKIYWDLRLSEHVPTVEFRFADVCMTVDEAIMITGLVRSLVRTCYQDIRYCWRIQKQAAQAIAKCWVAIFSK